MQSGKTKTRSVFCFYEHLKGIEDVLTGNTGYRGQWVITTMLSTVVLISFL